MWFQHIFKKGSRARSRSTLGVPTDNGNLLSLSPKALRQLNRLQLNASRFLPGYALGQRQSLRRKLSPEFLDHRSYVPGDDIRFVDWKASARQEHIFVKQGQQPREVTVYLLMDCSASMGWGIPPKSTTLRVLALALGYIALAQGDRLVAVSLSESGMLPLGPITGKGQLSALIRYLRNLPITGKLDLHQSLRYFRRHVALRSGLVYLLSDLLDVSNLEGALELLPAPGWDVVILHMLHQEELNPMVRGDYEVVDMESNQRVNYDITSKAVENYQGHMKEWFDGLENVCMQNNAFYTRIHTNWGLDLEILPHLRDMNVVTPI